MNSPKNILLTGGTGVIGRRLTQALLAKGYTVSHLSRSAGSDVRVKTYLWDVEKGEIDARCIDDVDIIVHMAGAPVAEKRWTEARKKLIVESRTKSIGLIYQLIKTKPNRVNSVISASATGYYGDRGEELLTEASEPGNDFLAHCCIEWEKAVDQGADLGLRILKFRTGIVLIKEEGALPQLAMPVKILIGSPLGSGKQWMPWIHCLDVVDMYLFGIENAVIAGVHNMTAPQPVTNKQMVQAIAKQLHKPLWAPNVPKFILKLLLGEMSAIALGGARTSAQKIDDAGFAFKYRDIESALKDIYG